MKNINRTARAVAATFIAERRAETGEGNGFVECAIISLGGLAITLLLIAYGVFPTAEQLVLLQ
jgi:hypothetical protein